MRSWVLVVTGSYVCCELLCVRSCLPSTNCSAGGNLTAATTQKLRDEPGRKLDFQVLVYANTNNAVWSTSGRVYAAGFGLTMPMKLWFRSQYLVDDELRYDTSVSPGLEPNLTGLPPCLTILATHDINRDEAHKYALRLRTCGVPCEIEAYPGTIHGFFSKAHLFPEAGTAQLRVADFIAQRSAKAGQGSKL
eukprot:m.110141 g.110141  ORF g.110141 m.110141 type:complete len:192 (-) comp51793_c0_seq6:289-864(-)